MLKQITSPSLINLNIWTFIHIKRCVQLSRNVKVTISLTASVLHKTLILNKLRSKGRIILQMVQGGLQRLLCQIQKTRMSGTTASKFFASDLTMNKQNGQELFFYIFKGKMPAH